MGHVLPSVRYLIPSELPTPTSTPTHTIPVVAQSLRSTTCTARRSHWPSWPLQACRRKATTTTRTVTRLQLWPAPPTCRPPPAPLPRATCPCPATALDPTPRARWPAAEWVAAAPRRPTRPSTRVPPVHRRLREALLDLVWLLSACCKPVESSRLGTDQSPSPVVRLKGVRTRRLVGSNR